MSPKIKFTYRKFYPAVSGKIKDPSIALGLCHLHGMMEYWNAGILGVRAERNYLNCKKLLQTHHSITPSFHYSNWSEAPKFDLVIYCRDVKLIGNFNLSFLKKYARCRHVPIFLRFGLDFEIVRKANSLPDCATGRTE